MKELRKGERGHWYDINGKAMHEVPNKSNPEEMRPTTLRDARTIGLYPSVTTILKVVAKDQLTQWKVEQAVLASLTLPRIDGESDDTYLRRLRDDMSASSEQAMGLGTEVHKGIESWLRTPENALEGYSEEAVDCIAQYIGWHKENIKEVVHTEKTYCAYGYAGTVDLIAYDVNDDLCIIDYKTQSKKPGRKMVAYDTYKMQLAAYARLVGCFDRVQNVMISTNPDAPGVEVVDITADMHRWNQAWVDAFSLWRGLKGFDCNEIWQKEMEGKDNA